MEMDDKPLDLSRKAASSNTESQLLSIEKKQKSAEDVSLNPPKNVSDKKESSKSVKESERSVEQRSIKPRLSYQTSARHETSKFDDKIKGNNVIRKRSISEKPAINTGAIRHECFDSISDAKNKYKPSDTNCFEIAAAECISPRPSTSAGARCSLGVQGYFTKSKEKVAFVCEYCSQVCTSISNYTTRVRTHTDEKPFGCPLCNKKFHTKGYLKLHIRSHIGEHPFQCRECGKRLSNSWILKEHERIHTGEKPYKCEFCSKAFHFLSSFIRHEKIHRGKPKETNF